MTNKQCERRLAQALGALHSKTDVSAVAGAMPAPAAATPVSVSRIHRVRRYVAAVAAAAVMVAGVGTWWLTRPEDKPPVVPATDDGTVTTTVTTAPTEGEDTTTTTTVNTTAPEPTTDGGIVAPPTTAPTTAPAPSKPTDTKAPTTGKTELTQTTASNKTDTPTATTTVTTSQTTVTPTTPTTQPQKIVITADEPDDYGMGILEAPLKEYPAISPALQEKMKMYGGLDVLYSVIVEVLITNEQEVYINNLPYNNAELLRLAEERDIAYQEFVDAKEQYGWTEEVINKRSVHRDIARQYENLLSELINEYSSLFIDQQLKDFLEWSNKTPIPLTADAKFYPIFASDPNHAFFMELTAGEINELAKRDGYRIRLVFPGGDPVLVMPE